VLGVTLTDIPVTTDLAPLYQTPGVDFLSAPVVIVEPGHKAKIEITRDFAIDGQEPIAVGVELEITADRTPTGLSYIAKYKLTEFEGFGDIEREERPVFQTTTIPSSGPARDNVPILLDASSKHDTSRKRYIYLTVKKD